MLTLTGLCTDMEGSGRYLSPRAARDWWTKGLLPRPNRRGLGRGKGTETFWTEPRVIDQARTAWDLLALYPRADLTLLSLWLLGFPISLSLIRPIYRNLIRRHFRSFQGGTKQETDDVVGQLAASIGRRQIRKAGAPDEARHAITDLIVEFFEVFYGLESELATDGLAERWGKAVPYLEGFTSSSGRLADFHPSDDDFATWARYVKEMVSLTAQRETIRSARDYELMRARHLILFVFGHLRRFGQAAGGGDEINEFGRRLLIALGRPAVPILIAVLRKNALRRTIISSLFDLVQMIRDQVRETPYESAVFP